MAEQQNADRKPTIDGQDASSVKYSVRFNSDSPKTIESVDIKFMNGRKEVAAFENLTRKEIESVIGKKNIDSIEAGTGAIKKGQEKDATGNVIATQGKLEKDSLEIAAFNSANVDKEKVKTIPGKDRITHLDDISKDSPGFATGKPQNIETASPENVIERADRTQLIDAEVRENIARLRNSRANQVQAAIEQAPTVKEGGNKIVNEDFFSDHNAKKAPTLPEGLEKKYLQVGNKYHYVGKPDLQAFEDKGNKLETKSNSEHVAGDLVRIANARGWEDIRVRGTDDFRRQVWLEASVQGMKVQGYKPTEADLAMLERRNREAPANAVEKGDAKIKDVQEAKHPDKDDKNKASTTKAQEKADDFRNKDRAEVIKRHPDLAPAYGVLKASQLFATEKIDKPSDRARFTEATKETLARMIQEDKKLPLVIVKDRDLDKIQKREAVLDR